MDNNVIIAIDGVEYEFKEFIYFIFRKKIR